MMPLLKALPETVCPLTRWKIIVLLFLLLFFYSSISALAVSRYVKPSAEIPIRSGRGTEYKILAVVPDGMEVEILEENDPWALVRTPGGTEGWMLERYLSDEPPLSQVVSELDAQNTKLVSAEEDLRRKYDELVAAYNENEEQLNGCIADRADIENRFNQLRADTADVIKIKKDYESAALDLENVRNQVAALQQENERLKRNTIIRWFLAGAGVLVLGILLGIMGGKSRRRKSSLY